MNHWKPVIWLDANALEQYNEVISWRTSMSKDRTPDLVKKCWQIGRGQETNKEWVERREALMKLLKYKRKLQQEWIVVRDDIFSQAAAA